MKNILRRHRVTILAFALVSLISVGLWYHSARADDAPTPPTKVIITNATVTDQGVKIDWIAAQPGTDPINDYSILKKDKDGVFAKIDQVGAESLSYIDASGQAGDVYQVVAEDDQDPSNNSAPSDSVAATDEQPGSTVATVSPDALPTPDSVSSPSPSPSTSATNPNPAVTSEKVAPLQTSLNQNANALGTAVSKNDTTKSQSILNSLQGYHQQILTSFPQLTTAQKQSFSQSCQQQLPVLGPAITLLPESDLADGLMVLAGCEAIQGLTP